MLCVPSRHKHERRNVRPRQAGRWPGEVGWWPGKVGCRPGWGVGRWPEGVSVWTDYSSRRWSDSAASSNRRVVRWPGRPRWTDHGARVSQVKTACEHHMAIHERTRQVHCMYYICTWALSCKPTYVHGPSPASLHMYMGPPMYKPTCVHGPSHTSLHNVHEPTRTSLHVYMDPPHTSLHRQCTWVHPYKPTCCILTGPLRLHRRCMDAHLCSTLSIYDFSLQSTTKSLHFSKAM